jgi:hypothetical protein
MIFDSGANITITHSLQDLMPSVQEQKEQRDIQELNTIRTELYYRLADIAEDNPNIIVGTVHQEFREVVEDHLHERVIETHREFRSLGNYCHVPWTRDKKRPDGTFSTKYRLVEQPPHLRALRLRLEAWQATSSLQHLSLGEARQMTEPRWMTLMNWNWMWVLAWLTVMVASDFLPKQ